MRRATAWIVVVGVACLGTPASAAADTIDGFWVSIASGVAGSSTATGYQDLWFETPHGPPPIAVTQLTGGNVEATTGGGSSFFTGGAVPVVLPTTDGYAYLAGGAKPSDLSDALKRQTSGGQGLATAAPDATATTPPENAALLTANLGDPDTNGTRALTVTLTDAASNPIGTGTVTVPDGGWWVIGLGPGTKEQSGGGGDNGGGGNNGGGGDGGNGGGGNNGGGGDGGGNNGGGGGPVATPEPATGVLLGIGGLGAAGWRLVKRRRGN
ncbi:PEP-CTERM sorting domain-containing protein [Gemmata obscuriglobus]|uniref:PEP-CTERM sorting domain-containing protein n=1 Tax=Gemmata obscuriglobus TaxID=114 RepID=UPI00016C4C3C|nr:PEP-CTERM sorting domain-containing protein [Gemmata obscuriglobus]